MSGSGGNGALAVGVEDRGNTIVVPVHRLVHPLREREIGQRIQSVEQLVDFTGDRRRLGGGHRGNGIEPAGKRLEVRLAQRLDQLAPVDHVVRFKLFDRHAFDLRRADLVGDEREPGAQRTDDVIEVAVAETTLQPIAEQGAEWLTGADALDQRQRRSNARGREIDRERVVPAARADRAGAKHRRGLGMRE